MDVSEIAVDLVPELLTCLESRGITSFLPAQSKAISAGLLDMTKNMLICTPTASGKTLIAEIAAMQSISKGIGKAVYIAPLKALASEKFNEFKLRYPELRFALSIGDIDKPNSYILNADFIIMTSEKMDSEIRHNAAWLKDVKVVIIDEIHLLNDPGRGPTLEILITILKEIVKGVRIIGLSATIGNPESLAKWLDAVLVQDTWRPVELKKGVLLGDSVEFYSK